VWLSRSEQRVTRRSFRREPDLYHFKDNCGGVRNGDPDADFFDRELRPGADEKTHHLTMLEIPPVVGNGKSGLPEHTHKHHKEKSEAKSPPVDKAPRHREKTHSRKQGSSDEKGEIAGESRPVHRKCNLLLLKPCATDQDQGEDQRSRMKLEKPAHFSGFGRVVGHVIRRQPKLAEPHVQKKNREKAGQIESVLLNGDPFAECGSGAT
jgi:hypothetical protein